MGCQRLPTLLCCTAVDERSQLADARTGRWWPAFEIDVMKQMLREAIVEDHWAQWRCIDCPTLVVRGATGTLEPADAQAMAQRPGAQVVEIADAGHDLHLERPAAWQDAVCAFLARAGGPALDI